MRISNLSVSALTADWCRLDLVTEDGLRGSAPLRPPHAAAAEALSRELLVGQDPRGVATLWERMSAAARRSRWPLGARASLDLACWDLKAQASGEPLWKALGGARPNAMAYASIRQPEEPDADPLDGLESLLEAAGFRWACLPLSGDVAADRAQLTRLSSILASQGGRQELLVDAGGAWPGDAVRLLRALELDFDIACVKGIGAAGDVLGNRHVADRIAAAVCAGGDLESEAAFQPWLHHRAANVVELDLLRLGVTGAQRVAEAAFGFELPVLLRAAPGNLQTHLAAALPNCMAIEVIAMDGDEHGIGSDVDFEDGRARAGSRPGLGLRFTGASSATGRGA